MMCPRLACVLALVLVAACSQREKEAPRQEQPTCGAAGASVECACPGGKKGAQVCLPNGTFLPCRCEDVAAADTGAPASIDPPPAAAPDPSAAPAAPSLTVKQLLDKGAASYVDRAQGLVVAVGDADPTLVCGAELDGALARLKKIVAQARSLQADAEFVDPTSCEVQGARLVCRYSHPAADPEGDPDSIASFVLVTGASSKPVLVASLLGTASLDGPKVQAALAAERKCP